MTGRSLLWAQNSDNFQNDNNRRKMLQEEQKITKMQLRYPPGLSVSQAVGRLTVDRLLQVLTTTKGHMDS